MNDKILGGLLGAAIGDAMGAATETRSSEQIIERFGGPVRDIVEIPDDVFAAGFPKGSVTDDFSLAYYTAKAIVAHKGVVDDSTAKDALLSWATTKYYKMAGPTTVRAVEKLKGNETKGPYDFLAVDNAKGSNGSAMKISPAGLVSGGDIDRAVQNAVTICLPTHDNSTSLAGACAVSAAIAQALHEDASLDDVLKAGIYGAEQGEAIGIAHGKRLANPSVPKRIKLAIEIAEEHKGDIPGCMKELSDIIGSGLSAAEAVPSAFGLLKVCEGNAIETIIAAVNIGNDTDTIATIAGSIIGTLCGPDAFDPHFRTLIEEANGFDLRKLAEELSEVSA